MGLISDSFNADRNVRTLLFRYKPHILFGKPLHTLILPLPHGYKYEVLAMAVNFESGARMDWRTYTRRNFVEELTYYGMDEPVNDIYLSQKLIKTHTKTEVKRERYIQRGVKRW